MQASFVRAPKASARPRTVVCKAAAAKAGNPVPDMTKRTVMNGILVGAGALPSTAMAAAFIAFFVPPKYAPRFHDAYNLFTTRLPVRCHGSSVVYSIVRLVARAESVVTPTRSFLNLDRSIIVLNVSVCTRVQASGGLCMYPEAWRAHGSAPQAFSTRFSLQVRRWLRRPCCKRCVW